MLLDTYLLRMALGDEVDERWSRTEDESQHDARGCIM